MVKYNVLWVDDSVSDVIQVQLLAEQYHLQIEHRSNWKDAYEELSKNYSRYDAIILDAYCKYDSKSIEDENFLGEVSGELGRILDKKLIPWYIFSAGTMTDFNKEVQKIGRQRKEMEVFWGDLVFLKDKPGDRDRLFQTIRDAANQQEDNIIRQRYEDVLEYVGDGGLIDADNINEIRSKLISALCAFHFPEKNPDYKYYGNDLRKVLEAIFDVANQKGILPDECFKSKDFLASSCSYMSGEDTSYGVRYGDKNKKDSIFPSYMGYIVNNIRKVTNPDSHYVREIDKDVFVFNDDKKYLYFGYVIFLCDMIKWFGDFVSDEKNIEEAKGKMVRIPKVGDICTVINDNGTICDGNMCLINLGKVKSHNCINKTIIIKELKFNTLSNKDIYPYYISDFDLK